MDKYAISLTNKMKTKKLTVVYFDQLSGAANTFLLKTAERNVSTS